MILNFTILILLVSSIKTLDPSSYEGWIMSQTNTNGVISGGYPTINSAQEFGVAADPLIFSKYSTPPNDISATQPSFNTGFVLCQEYCKIAINTDGF
jgi:hypothetical protein